AGHLRHVPMAEVGAEDRIQLMPEVIEAAVECHHGGPVLALAAEVEAVHELLREGLPVFGAGGGEVVDSRAVLRRVEHGALVTTDALGVAREKRAAVLLEELAHQRAVLPLGIQRAQDLAPIALLEALDQRVVEKRGPACAALEEGDPQAGKSASSPLLG